ncbi:protein kinase [Streptomyces sp. NPDC001941]|uniref:serine/threonine-protein kinase n=1 Tax=Streptomyces sp. NPDC001941 TaxID=3154659 RepID=UPI0033170A10
MSEHTGDGGARLIAGRYRVEDPLGRGGMGTVRRAYDELLGRSVAVKELHVERAGADATDTILREARAVARVRHPHVVVVHDVVAEAGRPYLVMELVEGATLGELLASRGPLPVAEAAGTGLALAGALRAAHALGVFHRDLKPANVLVEAATGRVVLTDFGIARFAGAATLTETGAFVGTPEYTAPERMQGAPADASADLWSLGVLLCELVSGESPFRRDSLGGVVHAVVEGEIRPPEAAGPLLPVVRGLLERDPGARWDGERAERLLREVAQGRSGEPVPHPPTLYVPPGGGRHAPEPHTPAAHTPPPPPSQPSTPHPYVPQPPTPRPPAPQPSNPHPSGSQPSVSQPSVSLPYAPTSSTPVASTAPTSPTVPGDGSGGPERRPPRRLALVAGALALVLAGAGASAAVLLHDGGGGRTPAAPGTSTGTGTDAKPGGTPSRASSSAPARSVPPSSAPPSSAPPSRAPEPSAGTDAPADAPDGYRAVREEQGYSLAVPEEFGRSTDKDGRVFYMSAGKTFRIGIRLHPKVSSGPLGAMRISDANGADTNPGYRNGSVTPTTHNGRTAALWEFTWNGYDKAEGARHTMDIAWDEGGWMYDVWVSAPTGRLPEARRYFDTVLDSFRVGS